MAQLENTSSSFPVCRGRFRCLVFVESDFYHGTTKTTTIRPNGVNDTALHWKNSIDLSMKHDVLHCPLIFIYFCNTNTPVCSCPDHKLLRNDPKIHNMHR